MVERKTPMATRRKKSQGLDATGWDIDKKGKRLKKGIRKIMTAQGSTANRREHLLFENRHKSFKTIFPPFHQESDLHTK